MPSIGAQPAPAGVPSALVASAGEPSVLAFEKNVGQFDAEVLYRAWAGGATMFLLRDGSVVAEGMGMRFIGGASSPQAQALGALPLVANYYQGNDPSRWLEQVPHFERVLFQEVYPGVDLVYYGTAEGDLEYDLVVSPFGDARAIRLGFDGARPVGITDGGDLRVTLARGELTHRAPISYQLDEHGGRIPVASRFVDRGATIGIDIGTYDPSRPLVIDPVVLYSTYHQPGSGGQDARHQAVAADGAGNAFVTGSWQSYLGGGIYRDGVVYAEYDAEGQLTRGVAQSGGPNRGYAIDVAPTGSRLVAGRACTSSPEYAGPGNPGGCSAFVAKLNGPTSIAYRTWLGGSAEDAAYGIAADSSGNALVTGQTCSTNFPTLQALQPGNPGGCSGFVAKLTGTGTLSFSTYLGGSDDDSGRGVATDPWDNAVVVGQTRSMNFPTDEAFQSSNPGSRSGFVTQFTSTGALSYSTYFGGGASDEARGVAVDPAGTAWVTGQTCSADLPAVNVNPGGCSAFVARLTRDGGFVGATYLGGSMDDAGNAIATDARGNALVTGSTCSADFPLLKPSQAVDPGACSAFVTKYTEQGELGYSTYLGGSGDDWGYGIAVGGDHNAIVTGHTCSGDFPTLRADESTKGSACAAFLTKLADPESPPVDAEPPAQPFACGSTIVLVGECVLPPPGDAESPTGNTPFGGVPLKPTFPGAPVGAPVNLATGELVARFRALSIDEPLGEDFALDLTFRSIGNENGTKALAPRWGASLFQRLDIRGGDYVYHVGDGRAFRFAKVGASWIAPPGMYAEMATMAGKVEVKDRFGTRHVFDPAQGLALTNMIDAAGNRWALGYNASGQLVNLTDPLGRVFTLQYDTAGRLVTFADPAGRTARFDYDGAGLLAAIRTPGPTAGTWAATEFAYDADGRILAIQDSTGITYTTFTYDPSGRVLSQRDALGGEYVFAYDGARGITQETDPNGNVVTWDFLWATSPTPTVLPVSKVESTRGLRPGDPASFTTAYEYNAHGELRRITFPAGNSETMRYDETSASVLARGNLLERTLLPGPASASEQTTSQFNITTRYTYHPACNLPTTIVDPRGTDPAFSPPNGGATSESRYTTTITYNAACKPLTVRQPRANPSGLPNASFTSQSANQLVQESFTYNAAGQVLTHVDAAGVITAYAYHPAPSAPGKPAGHLANVTVDPGASRLNLTTRFEYTTFGAESRTTDPNGNVRLYDVDLRGRTTQETSPAVTSVAGANASLRTRWTYDANDRVVLVEREKDASVGTFVTKAFGYDALGRLTSETVYPEPGHVLTTTYTYDANGNLIQRAGGAGEAQTWSYDERDLLLTASGPDGGSYAYDANGNLAAATDPLGRVTRIAYDGYGRGATTTDARGTRFVTSYDPSGNVVNEKALAANGRVLSERTYAHDELGRAYESRAWWQAAATMPLESAANPSGRWVTTLREHDPRGLATRVINDNGHVATTTYDAAGRPVATNDPLGNAERLTYDRNGNVATHTRAAAGPTSACPVACTTSYAYDALDRQVTLTNPDGSTRHFVYDGRGNLVRAVDEAGDVVWHDHDEADRPVATRRILDAASGRAVTTTTVWDDEGRVVRACDDAGACTVTTYLPGTTLVATQTTPAGPDVTNAYDAAGNLVQAAYSSGRTITFAYDELDRLTEVRVAGVPAAGGTTLQRFDHDELGRLILATDNGVGNLGKGTVTALGHVAITQQYDTLGHVIAESQLGLPVTHTLDGVGNVISTTYPSPDVRVVSRGYDAAERLARVWDGKGEIVTYAYQHDRVVGKDFGGPASGGNPVARTLTTHDGMERPATIQHVRGSTGLATLTTRYDVVGNRAAQKLDAGATDAYSQLFAHDALDRTTRWQQGSLSPPLDAIAAPTQEATWPDITGQNEWRTWSKDGAACARTVTEGGSPVARRVVDACPSGTRVYEYDADGNLASDGTHRYRWDFLNRLIRVEDLSGNLVVGYGYDALGRRVVKVFPDNVAAPAGVQAPREAWYTYVGQHVIQESQPVGSIQPLTVPPTAEGIHVIRQWVYGPAVDEVLAMDVDSNQDGLSAIGAGDTRYFYAYDSGANVLGLLDASGRLVEGYAYGAYGSVTILTPANGRAEVRWDGADTVSTGAYGNDPTPRPYSPSGNLWYFTGRQYDPEIGSYHYRARQYHPTLGQFMSIDPIGAWGDATSLGNPYTYVGNNPGTRRDPSGLAWWVPWHRDFIATNAVGTTASIATGALGGTAGLIASGGSFEGFARGVDAGASFIPVGNFGDQARERIRDSLATSAAPAYALAINDLLGPSQTTSDAAIGLAFSVIPVGGAGGKVLSKADDAARFAGVRELSATLKASSVSRAERVALIQSFEVSTIVARTAGPDETVVRTWGGTSRELNRWLARTDMGEDARRALALPASNSAQHLTEFGLKPGTRYFEGRAAPQFGHPGGGAQVFVPDTSALWLKHRWR